MKVSKKTDEIDFEAYIILPLVEVNKEVTALDGVQKRTFFGIPIIFSLTTKQDYFNIEIAFIIGLGLKLRLL